MRSSLPPDTSRVFSVPAWEPDEVCRKVSGAEGDFWIVRGLDNGIQQVFRDNCAHMGGRLRATRQGLMCDSHGWSYGFDGLNNVPTNPGLESVPFDIRDGVVSLGLPARTELFPRTGQELDGSESLQLLAHASYLLSAGKVNALFDPWLFGTTYWGSWGHFPEFRLQHETLATVTHIIITHPHPDHFHPETLDKFPRETPVFFPNFPSQIIPKVLKRMGFSELFALEWETSIALSDDVSIAMLRPQSIWEDSAALVRVKDWIWLNQNDAGAPLDDRLLPESVDLLSSAFDVGASGYPLTWAMSEQKADKILENSRTQMLRTVHERCERTRARFFSPFAGWWRHVAEEHQQFAHALPHVSFSDLRQALEGTQTSLLETLPSSQLVIKDMSHTYDKETRDALLLPWAVQKKSAKKRRGPTAETVGAIRLKLSQLSTMSRANACESVRFQLEIQGCQELIEQSFGSGKTDPITIRAKISAEIAALYAGGDETVTWDNLAIGYWATWSRDPDVYPANFMRLLQLGYQPALAGGDTDTTEEQILQSSVGDVLELNPELAPALLGRAGLPCAACSRLVSETLENALTIHSIADHARDRLISELRALTNVD